MTAPTRHLSNAELGRVLGLSPSGASKLRNGNIFPGPETLDRIVQELGAGDQLLFARLNRAQVEARAGDLQPWTQLLDALTTVPADYVVPEPAQAS